MSGGSYNYLFIRDLEWLLGNEEDLVRMVARLERTAPDSRAYWDAAVMLATIRVTKDMVEIKMAALDRVFKAVEWRDSYDWPEDRVRQAIAAYEEGERAAV
jgi:hypothetical protein